MPHNLRKIRKKRGSRTHGYGRVGQHRRARPRGRAGRHKHLWSYVVTYEPNYFGKKGFTSRSSLARRVNVVNVAVLDQNVESLSTSTEEGMPYVDLESLGFTKLLGSGSVTQPMIVKVPSWSRSAAEKIKDAGGRIIEDSEEPESSG